MPTEYLYLEKSANLQIFVPNTVSAQVIETKNDVLIHIGGEESGEFCNLPSTCKCPIQQTMQISQENSVNMFLNKGPQRIYTYYGKSVIMHLITNSVSTDSYCRTETSKVMNEVSSLSWNILPGGRNNGSGGFNLHQNFISGYISGVEFFTVYGKTYVVIGRYYNSVFDSHTLDSLLFKFDEDKVNIKNQR